MKRFVLSASIAACSVLVWTHSATAAKPNKKNQPAPAAQPVAVKKEQPEATPLKSELPSPWRTWSDPQGNKVEAAFCSLYGNILTVQTRDSKTVQMYLMNLVPEDRAFAADYMKRMRANSFADDYVKKAAYQIDFLIGSTLVANKQKFNGNATDEQYVRRIYLDAVGRIPTGEEASAFLADKAPDKRAKLVDKLLYSPGYTMHMYNWMGDMLRLKDTFGKGVPAFTFQDWLKDQLHADRPWDSLVRTMLTADGKLCDNGATGYLLYDAQMPLDGVSNLLTTFLGANVACAQCHDHPLADWKQREFYQMAAFFGAADGIDEKLLNAGKKLAKNGGKGTPGLNKGMVQKIASANAYRMEDTNKQHLTFPKDFKGNDSTVKPGATVTPTLISWSKADAKNPAYKINTANPAQLREEFAKWMTHPSNPRFAENIANRVWKKVFGLAVQEPVSDIDDLSKASNPALLAHLATIMKAGRFDLREFQRVLFNSQTYQRAASVSPDLEKGPYFFPGPLVRRLTAEQVWDSLVVLSVGPDVDNMLLRRGEDEKLMSLPGNAVTAENFKYVIDRMGSSGASMGGGKKGGGSEKGLLAEYQGGKPQQRFGMILARASELPQPAAETHFLRLFGQSDRLVSDSNTTDGSVPQALMLMNGGASKLITDTNCAAVTAADKAGGADAKVDALYLSFLGRKPTAEERPVATQAMTTGLGISDLAWALVNTREFLFVQ